MKRKRLSNRVPNWVLILVALAFPFTITAATIWHINHFGPTNPQVANTTRAPSQIVRFTVYDAGIFPAEKYVRAGSVVIRIEDLSGNAPVLVLRSSELRQPLAQIVRGADQWRGSHRIDLSAGRYDLYDVSHPNRQATLIVEP